MITGRIVRTRDVPGGTTAHVEIVEIGDTTYVLKTDTAFNVQGERLFQQELARIGLPHIETYEHVDLKPDQLLMEYVDSESINGRNFTSATLVKLGATLAKLHSRKFDRFQKLDARGVLQPAAWSDFIRAMAAKARRAAYSRSAIDAAITLAQDRLLQHSPREFVLCHGDAHVNNVFYSDGKLTLFDNNADAIVATPHYDLAVWFGEVLSGYRYGMQRAQSPQDTERMEALLEGYGKLPDDFEANIDDYVFLRLLTRYPNRFIRHQDDIIELLGSRYQA